MDIFDWYFKQIVTQAQMDWAFDRSQAADHALALDNGITGIVGGITAQEHAPTPDKTTDVLGPGLAYDKDGQRISVADALTVVDCSKDEFGTDSNPPTPAYERYISIFVRFERDLTEPALDGNNITVYTKQLEDFEFFVRLGSEAPAGTAVPAPLMDDAILVCDILVANGFTAITNADYDFSRREDWVRFSGGTIGDRDYGTSKEAVEDMLSLIDSWGGALPFTFTSQWFGPSAVAGPTPPPSTMQEALDAIVYDLALATGAAGGAEKVGAKDSPAYTYLTGWSSASLQTALLSVAANLETHIGGAAPQHPASAITFNPAAYWLTQTNVQAAMDEFLAGLLSQTAGTPGASRIGMNSVAGTQPEAIPATTLNALAIAIYGHLNDRTERAQVEVISGASWFYVQSYIPFSDPEKYFDVQGGIRANAIIGGCAPHGSLEFNGRVGYPYTTIYSDNTDFAAPFIPGSEITDICPFVNVGVSPAGDAFRYPVLLAASNDSNIIVEIRTRADDILFVLPVTHDISGDLGTDKILQIVSDMEQLYVLTDAGGLGTSMNLYAYDESWSLQWNKAIPISPGATPAQQYFTRMIYVNDTSGPSGEGVVVCGAGADDFVGPSISFMRRDGVGSPVNGSMNSSGSANLLDITYNPATGHLIGCNNFQEIVSATFPNMLPGPFGPYLVPTGAIAVQSDRDTVWFVEDGVGSPGSTIEIGGFNAASSAVDALRCQGSIGEIVKTVLPSARGARLCYDGKKMWVSTYDDAANRGGGMTNRRGCLINWQADSLPELVTGFLSADKMPMTELRHFTTPYDRDKNWPTTGNPGRCIYVDGYIFSIHNWRDSVYGSVCRTPASLWR